MKGRKRFCENCEDEKDRNKNVNNRIKARERVECSICKKIYNYSGITLHSRTKYHKSFSKTNE